MLCFFLILILTLFSAWTVMFLCLDSFVSFIFHSEGVRIHINRPACVVLHRQIYQLSFADDQQYQRAHFDFSSSLCLLHFTVCLRFSLTFSLLFTASSLWLTSSLPAFFGLLPFRVVIQLLIHKSVYFRNLCLLILVVPTLISKIRKSNLKYTFKSFHILLKMTTCKSFKSTVYSFWLISLAISPIILPRNLICF